MEGVINILKPPGMTSHDVVALLRRLLGEKRIGHCGTLDPEAAGVLPVCVGQATRLADYLSGGDKSYYCEMALGYETDTQDIWGATIWVCPVDTPDPLGEPEKLAEAARSLEGKVMQEAPAYSSVKREGKSLHQYAREGKPITGVMRQVDIRSIRLLDAWPASPASPAPWRDRPVRFIVDCGSGTYVRMICRDMGRKLGCGAAMSSLLRLRVGPFHLDQSVSLDEIKRMKEDGEGFEAVLHPKELALTRMTELHVEDEEALRLRHGQGVWLPGGEAVKPEEGRAWASEAGGRLVALGAYTPGSGDRAGWVFFKPDKTFL